VYAPTLGTKDLPFPQPQGFFSAGTTTNRNAPPQHFHALAFLKEVHGVWQARSEDPEGSNAQLHAREQALKEFLTWARFSSGEDGGDCFIQLPFHFEVVDEVGEYLSVVDGTKRLRIAIKV
jgi:hypothetical protein